MDVAGQKSKPSPKIPFVLYSASILNLLTSMATTIAHSAVLCRAKMFRIVSNHLKVACIGTYRRRIRKK